MTDFHVPAEGYPELPAEIHGGDGDSHGLIDLVRRDLHHDGRYDGQPDRLSYDLDGDGHFALVKEDSSLDH